MSVSTDEIVRRAIRHADRMAQRTGYEWSTARGALTKILFDLEQRTPDDASLARLRDYIAQRDADCARRKGAS
jgi:hypothetical protein